jgi:4-phytase / acid phosphatase
VLLLVAIMPPIGRPRAQSPTKQDRQLMYVVILTRHGVRSPTHDSSSYDQYSALPWPKWNVQPGNLTPHGFELMKLLGSYDRAWLARERLFSSSGCADSAHVTILADSDQRTRETGKALTEGMFPGCGIEVHALPEGKHDPLFHAVTAGAAHANPALEAAAIRGRIGGNAGNLTEAYRPQLAALDRILAGCGRTPVGRNNRISILDIPATLAVTNDRMDLRGPLMIASTLTENLLLEYTDDMPAANVGWGCVDGPTLRSLMALHIAGEDIKDRTPAIARAGASNLLNQILMAMEQQITGETVADAPGKPGDRLLLLVGHDTNIANLASVLHLDWILDGRRDDTPPGGALVFEVWRSEDSGEWSIRASYAAQTLEQMRGAQVLTLDNPPDRVPVFMPDCGEQDMSCTWPGFATMVRHALKP